MLEAITTYIASLSPGWFYFALLLSSFVENVVPPIPGDTVTVFAAYIVGRSRQRFAGVFLATTLGSTAGFMALYTVGRLVSRDYFIRRNFRFLPASSFVGAERWFQRYGYRIILANRFFSGIRSVISVVCGLYRLPWQRVLILSCAGCAVWNLLLIWAGYLLGANWILIEKIMSRYSGALFILMALAIGLWLLRKRRRPTCRPAHGEGESGEQKTDARTG